MISMKTCPNCGRKLHLYDWRPECPGCKTNLNYFNSNENLLIESEKAEREHALFQPKVDRAKAAYAGSKAAIARIVLTLLPIAPLFLPVFILNGSEKFDIIKVYNLLNEAGIDKVLLKSFSSPFYLGLTFLLLSAVLIIVSLILIVMSLGKHAKPRVIITYSLMFAFSLLPVILSAAAKNADPMKLFSLEISSVTPGIGLIIYTVLILVLFIFNMILLKKGIPIKYTQCFIGGLPSEEYFKYVEEGMSTSELRRKMLAALTEIEYAAEKEKAGEDE